MHDDTHWADDNLQDREFPDEDDAHGEDSDVEEGDETVACKHCGAEIYHDSEQCPICGEYITPDTSIWSGRSWWWLALAALGIAGLIYVLVFFPVLG